MRNTSKNLSSKDSNATWGLGLQLYNEQVCLLDPSPYTASGAYVRPTALNLMLLVKFECL